MMGTHISGADMSFDAADAFIRQLMPQTSVSMIHAGDELNPNLGLRTATLVLFQEEIVSNSREWRQHCINGRATRHSLVVGEYNAASEGLQPATGEGTCH